eukprot:TRINITY_DN83433_c0_g1_i1.p1 TRINITY_DN83433_c0_g1~~TRINITY_DN83433_c0_g1_i1.p1  ORF type:complete len:140 (+),score=47.36 TRINITY_DN83433_c0_g1_i1:70-489(+)
MGWGGKSGKGSFNNSWSTPSFGKGSFNNSWSTPSFGSFGGKGGKGWGKQSESLTRRTPAEKKVWIGGLPEDSTSKDLNKRLKEHLSQGGECKYAEVGRKGFGCAIFQSAEEVATVVATLNGSVFEGSVLEVDVWTRKSA